MLPDWMSIPALTFVTGLAGSGLGMFWGMKLGQARLEWRVDHHDTELKNLTVLVANLNEDSRVHDFELSDLCRKTEIERKQRQNWRFVGL